MAAEPLAPLAVRRKIICMAQETTSGTFVTTGVTDTPVAMAANYYDVKCELVDLFAEGERAPAGHYTGSVAAVPGKRMFRLSYKMDIAPAGPFLTHLTGAGFISDAGTYKPKSDLSLRKTWSIAVYEDGRCKSGAGCACKISIEAVNGQKLVASFEWMGAWRAPVDAALPTRAPITAQPYVFLGATIQVNGAAIPKIEKASIDLGANPQIRPDPQSASGVGHYLVENIDPKISIDPEARKVADQDAFGLLLAGTTGTLTLSIPTTTNTLTLTAPAVQRVNVADEARGVLMIDALELACRVSAGDDSLSFVEA